MQHTMGRPGRRRVVLKQRRRIYYSEPQKAMMWQRWKEGWTLRQIGQLFDRPHTSIQTILS